MSVVNPRLFVCSALAVGLLTVLIFIGVIYVRWDNQVEIKTTPPVPAESSPGNAPGDSDKELLKGPGYLAHPEKHPGKAAELIKRPSPFDVARIDFRFHVEIQPVPILPLAQE